jgi:hypothetical protein
VSLAKGLFLVTWLGLCLVAALRRWSATRWIQAVLLAFLALYGALSAQYLLWAVPVGLLLPTGTWLRAHFWSVVFGVSATLALVGFYPFLAPGVLSAATVAAPPWVGAVWVTGVGLTLVASLGWLIALVSFDPPRSEIAQPAPSTAVHHPG